MPELSVVIPTLNRGKLFHDTVRQVLAQDCRDFDLWVIDQSDAEERAANEALVVALADPRLHHVYVARKSLPNARNEALARVDCRVVLFLDDDVILIHPDFLRAHVDNYADARVGGVTGRIVERFVRPNVDHVAAHLSAGGRTLTNMWGTEKQEIRGLKGANMSYRIDAVRQVGGFDRNYIGTALLEDTDYSWRVHRAGWRLVYEPRAELVHLSSPTGGVRVEDALRGEKWRFRSTGYFVRKHRGWPGVARSAATFGAIALARAARWRDPSVVKVLMDAMKEGVGAYKEGPDQEIPRRLARATLPL
ncbi:MAG: glycosyltransferase [Deltaproteobacteria bacterium]|nr:glycosyltransferase [Deltaproteobacteria bacterium]